jgi:hypothetical protein
MTDQFTSCRRAIELLNEFRGYVVAAKRMVSSVKHVPGPHDFVAALQRSDVIYSRA